MTDETPNAGPNIPPSDLREHLTVFFVMEPSGDVKYGSNIEIDLPTAIAVVELGKARMVAEYYSQVAIELRKEQARKPTIVLPR